MSGGSTPVPGAAGGYAPLAPHGALSGIGAAGSLGSLGSLGGGKKLAVLVFVMYINLNLLF